MIVRSSELAAVAHEVSQLPRDGRRQVAFAGRSNVGKSSLINALLGRRNLARTSATPGKTRSVFFYLVKGVMQCAEERRAGQKGDAPDRRIAAAGAVAPPRLRSGQAPAAGEEQHDLPRLPSPSLVNGELYFVDLPGYGYAKVPQEERRHYKQVVERYFEGNARLAACVVLLDGKRPVGEEEIDFLHYLHLARVEPVVVFTRWDRVQPSQRARVLKQRMDEFSGLVRKSCVVSARTKEGIDRLWAVLDRVLGAAPGAAGSGAGVEAER